MMLVGYALALAPVILTAFGQICLKRAALKPKKTLFEKLRDPQTLLGISLFIPAPLVTIVALRFLEFSLVYSMTALNYIAITALSRLMLGETIDQKKIVGNAIIVAGILVYNVRIGA